VNLGAGAVGVADRGQRRLRHAMYVGLLPDLAGAANGHHQLLGQGIDHRDTHAVQTAGDLVAVIVELTASMQHGHDHFGGRYPFFLVDVHRNATAVVAHRDGLVGVDGDADFGAVASQRFVDGVVHHLEHHVVQAGAVIGVADVHAGALAHRIKALQHLDAGGIVGVLFAHASLRCSWVIRPCSTWNMATGVSVRQPSVSTWASTQVMNT